MSKLRWKSKGDSISHEFFHDVKEKSPRTFITKLTSPDGASLVQHLDIEKTCLSFYKELYSAPARDEHIRQCELDILNAVQASVTPLMSHGLGQPISEQELHFAACTLTKDKAPGPNGTTVNFFTLYWELIGTDFTQMIHSSIQEGKFPKGITQGLITLIPKTGDLKLLNN